MQGMVLWEKEDKGRKHLQKLVTKSLKTAGANKTYT